MKKILLVILFSSSACTYKPELLTNSDLKTDESSCFALHSDVSNRQEVYSKIKKEYAKYPGEKKLRFYYDINDYLSLNQNECLNSKWVITKLETESLFFSDTGKAKRGVLLTADVIFKKDKHIQQKNIQIKKVGDFRSSFTATKKKTKKEVSELLKSAFKKLKDQALIFDENL